MRARGSTPRAKQAFRMWECERRKRRSVDPEDLRPIPISRSGAYSIAEARKRLANHLHLAHRADT